MNGILQISLSLWDSCDSFSLGGVMVDFSILIPFTSQGEELMRVKKATVSAVL